MVLELIILGDREFFRIVNIFCDEEMNMLDLEVFIEDDIYGYVVVFRNFFGKRIVLFELLVMV